jgi:hypothetical protein
MNTTTIAPEVQEFLDAVRAQLGDLEPDEQREILDGLEADLADLVAERGREALGDPIAYARELRSAAGLDPRTTRTRRGPDIGVRVHRVLDAGHRRLDRAIAALPGDAPGFLGALRPVWWVLRGWIAVQIAALWAGDWALTVVPGRGPGGAVALVVGVVLSIQLGRGRLWPGDAWRRLAALRVAVLALNVIALAAIPAVANGLQHSRDSLGDSAFNRGFHAGFRSAAQQAPVTRRAGLYLDGTWVSNIYPYDAKGRPLVGVQLFNQIGQPVNVVTQPEYAEPEVDENGNEIDAEGNLVDPAVPRQPRVFYPWTNGATQLLNVFPIPSRLQDSEDPSPTAFTETVRPAIGAFPLATVPKVSLPGIKPGILPAER